MPVAAERKSLFARRDLVNRLVTIANSKSTSLYNLVNEIFEVYIELSENGIEFQEVVDRLLYYGRIQSAGFVLVPGGFMVQMINDVCEKNMELCIDEWFKTGVKLARFYKTLNLKNPLDTLLRDLEKTMKWLGEVTVKSSGSKLEVVIAGSTSTGNLENLLLELFKGVLSEFNYKLLHTSSFIHIIKAIFEKQVNL